MNSLCKKLGLNSRQTDMLVETMIHALLFYILSSPKMYMYTQKIAPMLKDRIFLHSLVFIMLVFMINKITNKI